ncbi:hypothetical protein D3C71_1514330 [compost metagenome]
MRDVLPHHALHGLGLGFVVERRTGAVGHDDVDVLRRQAGALVGILDGTGDARRIWGRLVRRIATRADGPQRCQHRRAARVGARAGFQHDGGGAIAHQHAAPVSIEWPDCVGVRGIHAIQQAEHALRDGVAATDDREVEGAIAQEVLGNRECEAGGGAGIGERDDRKTGVQPSVQCALEMQLVDRHRRADRPEQFQRA